MAGGLAALGLAILATPAAAHPHVWVKVESTVLYDQGKVSGFKHRWTFDDMYTAMAVQGLDKNGDGQYSREELAELAQVNIDGLKDFEFFTFVKVKETPVPLQQPKDYWLEHHDGVLTLNFTLPVTSPVAVEADPLEFAIYDQTFFIAFDLVEQTPIKLGEGAPSGCVATVGNAEKDLADLQALNNALSGALTAGNANQGSGLGYASTVKISCAKT